MASIRKRQRTDGGYSYAVLYELDGRQSAYTFTDAQGGDAKSDAEKFRLLVDAVGARRALEIAGLRDTEPRRHSMTLAEWLDKYITDKTGVEKKTIVEYRRYAEKDFATLGQVPLAKLSHSDIAGWVNAQTGSGKTISNKHGFLSGALKRAVKDGHMALNPCEGITMPKSAREEMVFLTAEEYQDLYVCFSGFYQPFVDFLVSSGARFSEVAALTPADVNRRHGTVRITRAWKHDPNASVRWYLGAPKTRMSIRTIDVDPSLLDRLDYSHEWLFTNTRGGPLRVYGWRENVWYPAVAKAKLARRPRIHDLRHTCASWMIAAKTPLPVIQRHLGHESIQTTIGVYGHLDRDLSKAAAGAIAGILQR